MIRKLKNQNFRFNFGFLLLLLINLVVSEISLCQSGQLLSNLSFNSYHTADIQEEGILVDSFYTVEAPYDTILIDSVHLPQFIEYNITVSLVSPHSCRMNLTIFDPSASSYAIMSRDMSSEQEELATISIPFGTAIAGDYTLLFSIETEYNLNLHIKIVAISGCFEEIIMDYGNDDLLFYRITKFTPSLSYIEHNVWLTTNVSYHFFMGRQTPLTSIDEEGIIFNYSIKAPDGIEFSIYDNITLKSMPQLHFFSFQTTQSGVHILKLELFTKVSLNIGYIILFPNQSSTSPSETQNPFSGNPNSTFYVPLEILVYIAIIISFILATILYVLKGYRQKIKLRVFF